MLGAHRRSQRLWVTFPLSLMALACAGSGADLTPGSTALGGRSASAGTTGLGNTPSSSGATNGGASMSGGASSLGGVTNQAGTSNLGGDVGQNGGSTNGGSSNGDGGTATGGNTSSGNASSTGGSDPGSGGSEAVAGSGTGRGGNVGAGSTCGNDTKDGDETDVDCGGSCAPAWRCTAGAACLVGRDCTTSTCISEACAAPIVVVKNAGCVSTAPTATCPATSSTLQARIQVLNVSGAALALKGLEIRYYYTDEATAVAPSIVEVFDKSVTTFDISLVAMPTPTPKADHYVKVVYSAGSLLNDINRVCDRGDNSDCAELTFSIHTANYQGTYDPANDYSFVPSTSLGNNGTITVHQNGAVIWGTAP